ncbi:MAG: DUF433 domain-containing protein [Armatimonadetes bacterium]|nr:DUF433 domain-containing protein [Armatimonadota bacterium]
MAQTVLSTPSQTERKDHEQGTERVPPSDPRAGLVSVDPERHSGDPCFAGTRVPIRDLLDYVEGGESLESFLASFPTIRREQAVRVLRVTEERLLVFEQEAV